MTIYHEQPESWSRIKNQIYHFPKVQWVQIVERIADTLNSSRCGGVKGQHETEYFTGQYFLYNLTILLTRHEFIMNYTMKKPSA